MYDFFSEKVVAIAPIVIMCGLLNGIFGIVINSEYLLAIGIIMVLSILMILLLYIIVATIFMILRI